jgi:hypothetical protein
MPHDALKVSQLPALAQGTLLLALTGWMDGGNVSTGTVKHLMQNRQLVEVARIEPAGFYIENIPGNMEIAALFRPHVRYEGGLVKSFDFGSNVFSADPAANLAFFLGKEPNLNWTSFADHIFDVARRLGVARLIFVGSFGGTVPHTREPRLYGSVSHQHLLPLLTQHALRPSDYDGPGSFASYLVHRAPAEQVEMLSIAAEIPGYLQGVNPLSIEAVSRRLGRMLDLPVNLAKLRKASTDWELQVSEAVEKNEELAAKVRELEDTYDKELADATFNEQ